MNAKRMSRIIELEWEMFSSVPNSGRRAACQTDPDTFKAMRSSQLCEWPEVLLSSYYADLAAAERQGRNLMTEKYAWMMESTFPEEFLKIVHLLAKVDEDALEKIEEIVAVNVAWKLAVCGKYPELGQRGRQIHTRDDSRYGTSFETYLRGELKTYSPATIRELHAFTLLLNAQGLNGVEKDLLHQVRWYGFASLEQAEQKQ